MNPHLERLRLKSTYNESTILESGINTVSNRNLGPDMSYRLQLD